MSAHSANTTEQIPTVIPGTRQPLKSQAKWKRVIVVLLAFIYIISPLDLIPDFIPVIGWLDDLGVLAWAAKQVLFNKDDKTV
jgi:uncharacterized membrane protein YkvA (DUF1232 family)